MLVFMLPKFDNTFTFRCRNAVKFQEEEEGEAEEEIEEEEDGMERGEE